MRKTWSFSFYFLFFAGVAAHRPYLVLFFQELGFSGAQIGLLVGVAPLISVLSLPLVTGLADRTNRHRLIMSLSLVLVVALLVVFPYLEGFLVLLAVTVLFTVFFTPTLPLSASAIMYMLGDRKDLYGRIRLGGTVGFGIIATVAGALVEEFGLKMAFWSGAALFFMAFLISQRLVHGDMAAAPPAAKGRPTELLKNPHFLLFLLLGFSGGVSFGSLGTYLFPYMKDLGAKESIMGLALTFGTLAEIPVLFYVSRFIQRFDAYAVLVFAVAMTALRFLLVAIAPSPEFILGAQLLNGFNYPLLTVAAVTYADEVAPVGFRATSQGLFNAALGGIGVAAGGFMGGLLFDGLGPRGMYMVIAVFLALVVAFVMVVHSTLPPEHERTPLTESI